MAHSRLHVSPVRFLNELFRELLHSLVGTSAQIDLSIPIMRLIIIRWANIFFSEAIKRQSSRLLLWESWERRFRMRWKGDEHQSADVSRAPSILGLRKLRAQFPSLRDLIFASFRSNSFSGTSETSIADINLSSWGTSLLEVSSSRDHPEKLWENDDWSFLTHLDIRCPIIQRTIRHSYRISGH